MLCEYRSCIGKTDKTWTNHQDKKTQTRRDRLEQHTTEMGHYLDQGEDERMADEGGGGEQRELKLREKER